MAETNNPLTPKQQRFVDEYLVDLNAAAAYRRAGYTVRNDNVAGVEGHRLLNTPKIAAVIASARQRQQTRTGLTADWVLNKLLEEAQFTGNGSSQSARIRATELLGKHLGLFKEQVEMSGPGGGPIPVGMVEIVLPPVEE
jgi:phage terminase small subunit